ncbi:MAG: pectinesterase family protein [Draconibacterium sp.]
MKQGIFILFLAVFFLNVSAQSEVNYEMVVAKDGSGDFTSIQAAVDATKAFPDKRITIYIKNGVYNEKVRIPSWNNLLSLIGEDANKTIISYNDSFKKIDRGRNSTFFTYTLLVESDDFFAENLTIENTAGQVGQAVALHVEGNRCVFKNCRILGNQDTLYLSGENSHQYFTKCTIEGTTDFIFGSATAVFRGCRIVSKSNSFITAASTNEGKEFGFVFMNCELLPSEGADEVYLGRPWRPFAKTVLLECYLGKHIRSEGWKEWSNAGNLGTSFYAEYKNTGPGSVVSKRVEWSHQLSAKAARRYKIDKILGNWILAYL